MRKFSDEELINLVKYDVEKGMEIVIQNYSGLVYTICQNILFKMSKEDIEDTIIDTYTRFWEQINNNVAINTSIRNYIAGIARHCAIDKLRLLLKDRCVLSTEEGFDLGIEVDMETEISKKTNAEIINKVLNEMPTIEKEIFIRRYFLYQRIKDIAKKMCISEKKVENILYRYKNKLRKKLEESGVIL